MKDKTEDCAPTSEKTNSSDSDGGFETCKIQPIKRKMNDAIPISTNMIG